MVLGLVLGVVLRGDTSVLPGYGGSTSVGTRGGTRGGRRGGTRGGKKGGRRDTRWVFGSVLGE